MRELWEILAHLQDWAVEIADAWWVHLVVFALSALDGFFPTVPSEGTIVSLSSLWSTSGQPSIVLLALAAWWGAFAGDTTGYFLGRKVGWRRFRFLREGRGRRVVEMTARGLRRRGLVFIMTGRYIPFGRTAVNLTAGAVGYPYHSFWPRSMLSTFTWAIYSVTIGAAAGAWFHDHHLVGIAVSLVAAFLMAFVVERAVTLLHRVLDKRHARRHGGEASTDTGGLQLDDDGLLAHEDDAEAQRRHRAGSRTVTAKE